MQGECVPIESNHLRLHTELKDKYGIPQLITSVAWTENDDKMVKDFQEQVRGTITALAGELQYLVEQARATLTNLTDRPPFRRPLDRIQQLQQTLDYTRKALDNAGKYHFDAHKNRLSLFISQLEALSPLKVLARGYSVARKLPAGPVLVAHNEITPGD